MILFSHGRGSPVFVRIAERMAAALGGEVVTDLDLKARDLSDVEGMWLRLVSPGLAVRNATRSATTKR